jgi:hypothetical protein
MNKILIKILQIFVLICLPLKSFSQNDITKFLDIPVDGFKSDMIQKLKLKGYSIIPDTDGVLEGEFNGEKVLLFLSTYNNKVWRVNVAESEFSDEINIKIKFNNLIRQFADNQRYLKPADTIMKKLIIPEDEDLSYQISVKKKRYDAHFYQKTIKYDSLLKEREAFLAKGKLNDEDWSKLIDINTGIYFEEIFCDKLVWFMIDDKGYNKYRILIFYENKKNEANGEGL